METCISDETQEAVGFLGRQGRGVTEYSGQLRQPLCAVSVPCNQQRPNWEDGEQNGGRGRWGGERSQGKILSPSQNQSKTGALSGHACQA